MRLSNSLKELKKQLVSVAEPAAVATMQRATRELEASGIINRVLAVGDRVPQFTLKDERGVGFALSDFLSRGPLVLHFFRGPWCPYCEAELEALQNHYSEIVAANATLVTVTPLLAKHAPALIAKHGLTFPLLCDPGNQVANQFGLVFTLSRELQDLYLSFGIDLTHYNGDNSWSLPMPARYLIDQKGVVRDASVCVDYTVRPDIETTLSALKKMTG